MIRPRTLVPVLLLASTPAFAKGPHKAPPSDEAAPKELIELRSQLFEAGREKAMEQTWKFWALCDEEGYPLVGNATQKSDVYQPSQFCAEIREPENKA